MKVIAIVGSPRAMGNTSVLVDRALEVISNAGIEAEKVLLGQKKIHPCQGHDDCQSIASCHLHDDITKIMQEFLDADGIILASPVYFQNVSAQMKIFIDRFRHPYRKNIKSKASQVGVISVAARTGADTVAAILKDFLARAAHLKPEEMLSVYGCARNIGDATGNFDLMEQAGKLGRDMAQKLKQSV